MTQRDFNAKPSDQAWATGSFTPQKGRLRSLTGTILRATMRNFRIGELVELRDPIDNSVRFAEVVGIDGEEALLTVIGSTHGISSRCEVNALGRSASLPVSDAFLGRVLDAFGNPIDGKPPLLQEN